MFSDGTSNWNTSGSTSVDEAKLDTGSGFNVYPFTGILTGTENRNG